jgi:hypothetical protein
MRSLNRPTRPANRPANRSTTRPGIRSSAQAPRDPRRLRRLLAVAGALATPIVCVAPILAAAPATASSGPAIVFAATPSPDFGSVATGQSVDQTFTLKNTGGSATAALKVTLGTDPAFTIPAGGDHCTGVALGPSKTCAVTVRYTPASDGASDAATLSATAKKPPAPAVLNLTGTSPSGLSEGCQDLNANPFWTSFTDISFNAGEVITLSQTPGAAGGLWRVVPPAPLDPVLLSVSFGIPAHYPVSVPGLYSLTTYADFSKWSCAAG